MGHVVVVLEAHGIRPLRNQGVLMGPLDSIIEGCVIRLLVAGFVVGAIVATVIWLIVY